MSLEDKIIMELSIIETQNRFKNGFRTLVESLLLEKGWTKVDAVAAANLIYAKTFIGDDNNPNKGVYVHSNVSS